MVGQRISPSNRKKAQVAALLLQRMIDCLRVEGSQIVYSDHSEFESLAPILADSLSYPSHWVNDEIGALTRRAVLAVKRDNATGLDNFVVRINDAARSLSDARLEIYEMWTRLSFTTAKLSRSIKFSIHGNLVQLRNSEPSRLKIRPIFISGIGDIDPDKPMGGIVAVASGKFRSDLRAGSNLYEAINDIVSVINFSHRRLRTEWHSGKVRPKAKILLADNQFLFRNGRLADENMSWYNADYNERHWYSSTLRFSELMNLLPYVRYILRLVNASPSGLVALTAIRMMADGLNSHSASQRVLRSWTAFELLLSKSTKQSDDQNEIIQRAIFPVKDRAIWDLKLRHAVRTRNRFVHENSEAISPEAISTNIDSLLCFMIEWVLRNSRKFGSHKSLLEFLDLDPAVESLKAQISLRRKALHAFAS